jgi:hypothetical protein
MPFKANAERRHHIPKQKRKVVNWAAYEVSLRQRGSLTVWFTTAAIPAWHGAANKSRWPALLFAAGDPDGADAEGRVPARSALDRRVDRFCHSRQCAFRRNRLILVGPGELRLIGSSG